MRLTLTPNRVDVVAAETPDDPHAPEEEAPRRRVAGLAVPYEQEARVGFQVVTFAAGSVHIEGRVPLLLGHDPQRPVGVLVASEETAEGLRATYGVDATADGDAALVQAASGSRAGLSVGVDVDAFEELDAGEEEDPNGDYPRIRVLAARLAETSLVALAAYPAAGIDHVAAHKPEEDDMPFTENTADGELPAGGASAETPDAPRRPAPIIVADRPVPELRLGEYVKTLVAAHRGDRAARERIEAALTRGDVTTSPGVVPVAYVQTIVDGLGDARPLYDAVDHAEMPPAGMTIRRPVIATRPDGAFLANDQAGAPSGAVAINNLDVTIREWAWGGSASVALVERSAPSYIEEVFAQAVKSYHRDVEADIGGAFPAATGGPATLGAAIAAFTTAYRRAPTLLVCGAGAYGKLVDARGTYSFIEGSASAAGGGTVAGLRVVSSPDVASGDAWVTLPEFQEVRESAPIRLSVSDVTSLSLEIGVVSFYSRLQTLPNSGTVLGAVGIPAFAPVADAAVAAKK